MNTMRIQAAFNAFMSTVREEIARDYVAGGDSVKRYGNNDIAAFISVGLDTISPDDAEALYAAKAMAEIFERIAGSY